MRRATFLRVFCSTTMAILVLAVVSASAAQLHLPGGVLIEAEGFSERSPDDGT